MGNDEHEQKLNQILAVALVPLHEIKREKEHVRGLERLQYHNHICSVKCIR